MKTLLAGAGLLAAAVAAFLYSGSYDFGADAPHWTATARLIAYARDRSLDSRAASIKVPALDDPRQVALGAQHYAEMCAGCHLAPGVEDSEIRQGLYPTPPKLADPWPANPARQFWVIKHGIKLSAMPAWGATHPDDVIWAIVAFLQKLQGMSPQQYEALTREPGDSAPAADEHESHDGHHHHGATP